MSKRSEAFEKLCWIIERLRDPEKGCPWDREQSHESLKPYLLEEAYELIDAIDDSSPDLICDELGDVLLQVLLHAQIAADQHKFSIGDVVDNLREKLIRRHPHVFGETTVSSADEVTRNWDTIKEQKEGKPSRDGSSISRSFPALYRAYKLGKKAKKHNFDWATPKEVWQKVEEEFSELREALAEDPLQEGHETREELGDLLFTVAQFARLLGINPEEALQRGNDKFIARFSQMHQMSQIPIAELSPEEREKLWEKAKRETQRGSSSDRSKN